jgi:hypothetical protein
LLKLSGPAQENQEAAARPVNASPVAGNPRGPGAVTRRRGIDVHRRRAPSFGLVAGKDNMTDQPTRACPFCAEIILAAAKKCRYCGEFFPEPSDPEAVEIPAQPPKPLSPNQALKYSSTWWVVGMPVGLMALLLLLATLLHETGATPATSARAPIGRTDEPASLRTPGTPAPQSESEDAKIRRGCKVAKILYESKPISKLTLEELGVLRACRVIGE